MSLAILIVDDDSEILSLLNSHLTARGHRCVATTDSRLALDLIRTIPFDAVITDIVMPDVTGRQVATLCDVQQMPCVVLSGSIDTAGRGMPARAIVLEKDGDLDRLMAALELQLHRRRHLADADLISA